MNMTTTALVFEKGWLEAGEEKTFCVAAPKGKYTPTRLLILSQTARGVLLKGLKVSDKVVLGETKISDRSVDFGVSLQALGSKFSVVNGCVFELTLLNVSKERVEVLAGITGFEEVG